MSQEAMYDEWCDILNLDVDFSMKQTLESVAISVYQKVIPLKIQISQRLIDFAENIIPKCIGDMSIDRPYLCKLSLLRQAKHLRSLVVLAEANDPDVNLISRSMFEGVLYFFYLVNDEKKMREWRLFTCVEIEKIILDTVKKGQIVPDELLEKRKLYLAEMNLVFQKKDLTYHSSWKKAKKIKDMAEEVNKFKKLYEECYQPLSDYHHWGLSSLRNHYQINSAGNDIDVVQTKTALEMINKSIDLANTSMFSTLEAAINIFRTGGEASLISIKEEFLALPFVKVS
jgi:hypothetical protein